MYKVFIENKAVIFQISSQFNNVASTSKVWQEIHSFINSDDQVLTLEINSEKNFREIFHEYELIQAAGGLVRKDQSFLFIKRNGFWDIPKGKLEGDETPEVGAIREIEEECGIESPVIVKHLINTWHTYEFNGVKILKKTWWYLLDEGIDIVSLVPQAEEGITDVLFLGQKDFSIIREKTYKSIIEVMDKLESQISIK